ncbi:Sodium channel modifier 1 [Trichoplax sp. H2]|uniref:Sodium channel modifier 1 n=1 Tax=Trichoplax adhaerens TaxID=10228 RepID=B3RKQ1_TRIAD|nr:hypothetical protein TRIADDRAFT_51718 [Trichoplax adhaerens]EDV28618.1 hypothetical protein TRIADDRAFT_51718 [Trichoplax adhaerens]RDD44686.1 Sodium channel modifier 1 [Trichoplax sp. H2]|eukprot:XP_002107820.1 hypothetical protein TRIADDRAFT_51718 [Trichoplax adhaerens]
MSFKLVGDNFTQQRVLKKRRVTELLANSIDEDEAQLTKNGRYVCLVCSKHPVFDTIEMLCVHRKGKKHAHWSAKQLDKKKEILELLEKRQQVEPETLATASNATSVDPLLRDSRKKTIHALLTATPYNPCVKPRNAVSIFQPLKRKRDENPRCSTDESSKNNEGTCISKSNEKNKEKKVYVFPPKHTKLKNDGNNPKGVSQIVTGHTTGNPLTTRYIQLRSLGWRLDANGNWFKDENVEFESDEEEPEPLFNQKIAN